MEKRGFELSFTFIFSLILIAVFIFVAIWAIKHFLELKDRTMIQTAIEDLKSEVAEVWQAEESRKNITLLFPTSVQKICFANFSSKDYQIRSELSLYQQLYHNKEKNVFILPSTLRNKYDIEGAYMVSCGVVNCLSFTNPLCVDVRGGKVNLVLKGLPDGKVNVSKS